MRKYIDIINEANREDALSFVVSQLKKGATFVAHLVGKPGDGSLTETLEVCRSNGFEPQRIEIGHSCVGKSSITLPTTGLVILDVQPHNLAMCLGTKGYNDLENQICAADRTAVQIIIITKDSGTTGFGPRVNSRFPTVEIDAPGRDLEDGDIHRIV